MAATNIIIFYENQITKLFILKVKCGISWTLKSGPGRIWGGGHRPTGPTSPLGYGR